MPILAWGVWYTDDSDQEVLVSLHTQKKFADSEKENLQEANLDRTYFVRNSEVTPNKGKLEVGI